MAEAKGDGPRRIKKLDEAVVNRIAAGEIIQRPANALKEMIENSLDAGAKSISVVVKDGGLKVLQIQDDGCGISLDDFGIVCERFTTSKLEKFEDLQSIATYGFRGEALASISHVAHVFITSRTASSPCAYKAKYSDGVMVPVSKGQPPEPRPSAGNKGTQILVEDLFYNVTTRRKALNSASEEFARVYEVVSRYAIHNAGVAFSLKKHGEITAAVRTVTGASKLDNIRSVFGSKVANELIEIACEDDSLKFKMKGLASNANYSQKKGVFILFINQRLVNSGSIKRAIDHVYTTYLPKGMHSFIYLSLELAPRNIDVNVHPTKMQVHFLNEDTIIDRIQAALSEKLTGGNQSRTYLTQTLLPGASVAQQQQGSSKISSSRETSNSKDDVGVKRKSSGGDGKQKLYDHELVRTDSRAQTMDAFVKRKPSGDAASINNDNIVAPINVNAKESSKDDKQEDSEDDWDPIRQRPKKKKKISDDDPKEITINETIHNDDTMNANTDEPSTDNADNSHRSVMVWPPSNTLLTSVLELRSSIKANEHTGLRHLFRDHIFVGWVDKTKALIQHRTKLYITRTQELLKILGYQLAIRGFSQFSTITLDPPASIKELVSIGLKRNAARWNPNNWAVDEIVQQVSEKLVSNGPMLEEYFAIHINENAEICKLPLLLSDCCPALNGLPEFVLGLTYHVNWEEEKECFETIASQIGEFYKVLEPIDTGENSQSSASEEEKTGDDRYNWMTEHRIYPALRGMFQPPMELSTATCIVQIADLHHLYKVFERC
eukprot:m.126403 g.126403  ORF g.126403 m.126403 type:complete len:777 (-) comp14516_c0_seq5:121-2451(-)